MVMDCILRMRAFTTKTAEEVGLMSSEVAALGEKHQLLVKNNLNIHHNAWGEFVILQVKQNLLFSHYMREKSS